MGSHIDVAVNVPQRTDMPCSALQMLPHEPTWATVGLFSAGSVALGAIATASILNAWNRGRAHSEPQAKRQKLSLSLPHTSSVTDHYKAPADEVPATDTTPAADASQLQDADDQKQIVVADCPATPDAGGSSPTATAHLPNPDSMVDLQKLQELEQRVADLNALAELGKVYQDSLALSAQLRNLSSFRLQQDKVLGRGSLAVVQEGEYAGDSVAVKLLPIGSVFAEDSRKEACLALCLHHPDIVRVVGVHLVEVEARPYLALVQETAPGGDLGWQIEDCDFHTGRGGAATLDVALKLLLDAARGLAYMHHVDVVHGDVKSRNLLVFWEPEDSDDEGEDEQTAAAATAAAADEDIELMSGAAEGGESGGGGVPQVDQLSQGDPAGKERPLVWTLKWCDFGVSFRAAEAPGGVLRTVLRWMGRNGQKPIVYDREWRMHVPNPDLLRLDGISGGVDVPRALADLVLDCGAYRAADRPHMDQRYHYEVLIENDDDPITAEAVAHTLDQYGGGSMSNFSRSLAGQPHAVRQHSSSGLPDRSSAGPAGLLHHCATAPSHSYLLDTVADVAAAAAGGGGGLASRGGRSGNSSVPSTPINITGAVSRAPIELLPAHEGWFLASNSSFKKGMWLEKRPASIDVHSQPPAARTSSEGGFRNPSIDGGAAALGSPMASPLACAVSPIAAGLSSPGSFSLHLRRELHRESNLEPVAEDADLAAHGAGTSGGIWQAGNEGSGGGLHRALMSASTPQPQQPSLLSPAGNDEAAINMDAAAARALRRSHTTRRLGNDVLAAAGALSKALSAFSSASQALPAAAAAAAGACNGGGSATTAVAAAAMPSSASIYGQVVNGGSPEKAVAVPGAPVPGALASPHPAAMVAAAASDDSSGALSDSQTAHIPAWETFGSGSFTARDFSGLSIASYAAGAAGGSSKDDGRSAFAGFPSPSGSTFPAACRGGTPSLPLISRHHSVDCGARRTDSMAVPILGSSAASAASAAGDEEPPGAAQDAQQADQCGVPTTLAVSWGSIP
eukprot:gene9811-9969_t